MKTSFLIIILAVVVGSPMPVRADEVWNCTSEVTGKTAGLFGPCWNHPQKLFWACKVMIRETCKEKYTGNKKVTYKTEDTGECKSNQSECW